MTNLNEREHLLIETFFSSYGVKDIRKYLEEIVYVYVSSNEKCNGLEFNNLYWFTVELAHFLDELEPIERKKNRLKSELSELV